MASPSPNDLTRQQLDELDALLQRMLSLPLSPPAGAPPEPAAPAPTPPAVPAGWRFDAPAPRPAARPHVAPAEEEWPELAAAVAPLAADPVALAASLPLPPSAPVRLFAPPTPDTGVRPPTEPAAGPLRGVDAPALPAGFRPPAPPPAPEPPAEEAFAELTPAPAAAPPVPKAVGRVPVPLWPLFAANWLLEAVLGLFGPLGDLLTWAPVKHLLGWTGLGLAAGAGAWAARGMGWVSW